MLFFIFVDYFVAYVLEKNINNKLVLFLSVFFLTVILCVIWVVFFHTQIGGGSNSVNTLQDVVRMLFIHPLMTTFLAFFFRRQRNKEMKAGQTIEEVETMPDEIISENKEDIKLDMDALYDIVASELNGAGRQEGLWLKALDNSEFDENGAKQLYIQYRKEQEEKKYRDEIERQKEVDVKRPKYQFRICPYCGKETEISSTICECGDLLGAEPVQFRYLDEMK